MGLPSLIRSLIAPVTSLLLYNENETFLFPATSGLTITLTAGNPANTFGPWVEIVDNLATPFSSVFAAQAGYISEIMTFNFSVANEVWVIEISYGATNIVIGRQRVRSDWTYLLNFLSRRVPAGQAVFYRAMSETGLATCRASFRYFYI